MTPEMYSIIGVGVGLAGLILTLFFATWQMMNSRFQQVDSRFEEVNSRILQVVDQIRQLAAEMSLLEPILKTNDNPHKQRDVRSRSSG